MRKLPLILVALLGLNVTAAADVPKTPFHPKEHLCRCPAHPDVFSPHPLVHHARACCTPCPICGEDIDIDMAAALEMKNWGHFEIERQAFLIGCTAANGVRAAVRRMPPVASSSRPIPGIADRQYLIVHVYRGSNLTRADLIKLPGVEIVDSKFENLNDKSNGISRGAYLLECSDVSRARRALGWVFEVWDVRPHEKDPKLLWVDTIRSVESEVTLVSLMTIPGVVKATPGKARL